MLSFERSMPWTFIDVSKYIDYPFSDSSRRSSETFEVNIVQSMNSSSVRSQKKKDDLQVSNIEWHYGRATAVL